LRSMNIVVRPHPYNCHAWDPDPLTDLPGVTVFPRRGYNLVDEKTRADFFDSIYHSAAVVGINTSAMIEASIVGRPVFSMLAEEFTGTQEGTIHFHHLLPENGGCVRFASSIDEHVRQLSERLLDPEATRAETERFIVSFIRPHGLERPATPIFVDTIERLATISPPPAESTPPWAYLLRPVILTASAAAATVDWFQRPEPLAPMRKRLRKATHRARKRVGRTAALISDRTRRRAKLVGKRWQKSIVKPLRARRS